MCKIEITVDEIGMIIRDKAFLKVSEYEKLYFNTFIIAKIKIIISLERTIPNIWKAPWVAICASTEKNIEMSAVVKNSHTIANVITSSDIKR